jgi:hypothetical protein
MTQQSKSLNQVEIELNKKFMCSEKFSNQIECLVKENSDMDYISAIVFFCEKNQIDIENVSKLISKPLKEKLKWNAMELNFLKKSSRARLPI